VEREGNGKGYRKGFVCCHVVRSAGVTVWGRRREMEMVTERGLVCCNIVMCVVVWSRVTGG
jgi:hypothetical protein